MNTLVALCAVGAEKILGNEIKHLGYKLAGNAPGRVSFYGDDDAFVRANLCLRTADRLYLQTASYPAGDFDALFDGDEVRKHDPCENHGFRNCCRVLGTVKQSYDLRRNSSYHCKRCTPVDYAE